MTGLHVTVPIACWRKGLAREYLETEYLPPPATCYGFLLSLVGETDRRRHIGCRVTAALLAPTNTSVILRTVWRVKKTPLGSAGNTRPDFQQLLSGASSQHPFIELLIWLDSTEEADQAMTLEQRTAIALSPDRRGEITRFGGLSLGESAHLVDAVSPIREEDPLPRPYRLMLLSENGQHTLPVWVDHVGSAGTRYAVVDFVTPEDSAPPPTIRMPQIRPH